MKKWLPTIIWLIACALSYYNGYMMGKIDVVEVEIEAAKTKSICYAEGHRNGYKKGIGECANLCSLAFSEWWEETNIIVIPPNIKVDVKKVEP